MHESYEDNHDDSQSDWNKFYFKFDVTHSPLSDWVKKTVDKLLGDQFVSFPVNDWLSNTGGGNSLLYLGNNHYNEPIYKTKHFIENKLLNTYTNHIQQHALYFIKQPMYYKGLYDILN
jgi:hypothetical protein